MAIVTQAYAGVIVAPWLQGPQPQFASFTFDDEVAEELPTYAAIREEFGRRSAFGNRAESMGDNDWPENETRRTLDLNKVGVIYMFALDAGLDQLTEEPENLGADYIYPLNEGV